MPSQWWTYESEDTIRKRKAAQFERDAKAQRGPNPPTPPPPTPKGPATGPGAASNFERYAKDALLGVVNAAQQVKDAPLRWREEGPPEPIKGLEERAMQAAKPVLENPTVQKGLEALSWYGENVVEPTAGAAVRYRGLLPNQQAGFVSDLAQGKATMPKVPTNLDEVRNLPADLRQEYRQWEEPFPGAKFGLESAVDVTNLIPLEKPAIALAKGVGKYAKTSAQQMAKYAPSERGSLLVPGGEPTPKGEVPTPSEAAPVPPTATGPEAAAAFNQTADQQLAAMRQGGDPVNRPPEPWEQTKAEFGKGRDAYDDVENDPAYVKAARQYRMLSGDVLRYSGKNTKAAQAWERKYQAASDRMAAEYTRVVDDLHRQSVTRAISEGEPVPEAVLRDYPDLTAKYGQKQPTEAAAVPVESDLTPPAASTGELPAADAGPSPASAMQAAPDEAPKVAPETPARTLPPFRDNELKPLSKYTDTLYREIGGEDAGIYIPTDATRLDLAREEVYLSNSPDLALGQGENKGILLEFDAGNIQGQVSGAKPTWKMLWEQGEGEFIGRYNQQTVYRDALRAVTVKADAAMPKSAKARLKMALSALEQQGWTKTANPDGSVTYRRPAAGEGVPPAVARPEPAAFTEPAPVAAAEPATVAAVDETPAAAAPAAVAPEAPTPAEPGAPTPPVPPRPTTTGGPGGTPPTPPPAATGGTPPIGPRERAGNILLEKHPEDIRDVLAYTHDEQPVAMEEARRGVRPDDLVKADAEALEGMVGSKIKKWKAGDIWNAETILAARLALEKAQRETLQLQRAVVGGDNSTEALVRFRLALERASDMQLAVQGVTAELGRGLRQFRQAIPGTLDADALERALADPATATTGGKGPRPVRDPSSSEVLGRVLEQLGGREWTEKLVKELGQLDVDNPIAVANFIRNVQKPGLWDYVMEMRYNNMLSGAATQVVNSISNAATAMSAPIERGLAATVEVPLALAQRRQRQRFFHEVPAEAVGLVRGIPEGVRRALFIIRHGYGYEDLTRTELSHPEAFKGALGHVVNLMGSRWMRAADALFRSINYSGAYNAEAYRLARREGLKGQALAERMADLLTNPTPELMQRSADTAAYRVYQQKGGVATQGFMTARNKLAYQGVPIGRLIVPFVQTPVNLTKYGLERSPLGILNPDLMRAVRRGDPAASDMLGRWVAGMAIAAPLAIYAWQGKITGRAPTDRNERDRFYREGKQPYSLKIGDQWHSYQRAEPFNQTFTQVAALVNAFEKTGEAPTTLVADVGLTIARNLFSQSYMEGLGDALDALEDPGRYGGRYLERFATSFLPASSALRTATRIVDPVIREPKGMEEALEANIPGMSENVPAKMNVFGQEAKRETPWWSPYAVSTAKSNRVDEELARLGIEVGGVTDTIGKVKLNREQGVAYRQQAGQMTETGLKVLVLSKYYQEADDEAKARAIRYVTAKTHDLARENVATTLPGGDRAGQKQRFTAAELRLRSLDYLSAWLQYQAIPKYAGMDAKEAEVADQHARKVRALARERNVPEKAALAYYSRIDPEGTELAYRVMRQGTNPQRTAFRRAHPELTGYIDEDLAERAAAMPEVPSTEVLQQIAAGVR